MNSEESYVIYIPVNDIIEEHGLFTHMLIVDLIRKYNGERVRVG